MADTQNDRDPVTGLWIPRRDRVPAPATAARPEATAPAVVEIVNAAELYASRRQQAGQTTSQ